MDPTPALVTELAPASAAPMTPELAPVAETALEPITTGIATPIPGIGIPAATATPTPSSDKLGQRLASAAAIPKSDLISKFTPKPTDAVSAPINPLPTNPPAVPDVSEIAASLALTDTADQTASVAPISELTVSPSPAPMASAPVNEMAAEPAPLAIAVPMPTANPPEPELPNQVVTQIENNQKLAAPASGSIDPAEARNQALKLALGETQTATNPQNPTAPKLGAMVAAGLAVVVMGGYIWLQNYPRMALHAAAGKAGFTASLPGYVPSSYSLSGSVDASSGQVAMHYNSPSSPGFTITQKVSAWDSQALLDNYVADQTKNYTAINGQGLTIYLYNNNQATWVNQGIWYSIVGATRLSSDQILKIAYSL